MTQAQRLQAYLETGKPVTRLTAWNDIGIAELSSRIIDLTRQGYAIQRQRITVVNRYGERVSVMEYRKKVEPIKTKREWLPLQA